MCYITLQYITLHYKTFFSIIIQLTLLNVSNSLGILFADDLWLGCGPGHTVMYGIWPDE